MTIISYVWSIVGFRAMSATSISLLISVPVVLYSVGMIRKDKLRRSMFNAGFIISQKFKKIPFWDKYIEPAFIKNFATFVVAGNALLEGMVSDNDQEDTVDDMKKMRDDIKEDLKEFEEIEKRKDTKKGDKYYTDITNKLSGKIKAFLHLENKALDNHEDHKDEDKNDSIFRFGFKK